MKNHIAIAAFIIFFLAQFGRVINFCYCSMATWEHAKTFSCDCEKQLFTAVKTDNTNKDQTSPAITSYPSAEELFHLADFSLAINVPAASFMPWPKTSSEALYNISGNSIFHPPLSI